MLPEEPEVLLRPRPAKQAEGVLLIGGDDQIHAPHLPRLAHKHTKHLVKPASYNNLINLIWLTD